MIGRVKRLFDSESKMLAKNSSWMLISVIYQSGIVFIKSVLIARALGLEVYGAYATMMAFVAAVQEIFNLNIGGAMIKFAADYTTAGRKDKLLALFKLGYVGTLITMVLSVIGVMVLVLGFYRVFFDLPGQQWLIVLFSVGTSMPILNSIPKVILRIFDKFKINSIVNMVIYSVELIVIYSWTLLSEPSLHQLVSYLVLTALFNAFVCNVTSLWEVRNEVSGFWNQSLSVLKPDQKALTQFIFNNSLSKTLQKLMKKGDVLILAAFSDSSQVGLYDVARKLAFSMLIIKDPVMLAVYPQIAKLVSNNQIQKLRLFLKNLFALGLIPYVLGTVTISLLGNWIIRVVFGAEFVGAGNALVLLVMAIGLEILFFWSIPYILSLGKTGLRLRASLASSIITVLMSFVLVSPLGALGVAMAILCGVTILQCSFLWVIIRHLKEVNRE